LSRRLAGQGPWTSRQPAGSLQILAIGQGFRELQGGPFFHLAGCRTRPGDCRRPGKSSKAPPICMGNGRFNGAANRRSRVALSNGFPPTIE
jgi:hypothetical protein